jgi:membrane peptidoglycan carboxypeptidase
LYLVGLQNALDLARTMGISTLTNPSRYGLSLVLGGGEVKLTDLVNAYSVFAQDGVKHEQHLILNIQDANGKELYTFKDSAQQIVEPQYVRAINTILSDIGLRSGLFSASLPLTQVEGYQIALKTGTTNDYRDAWTVGYTPFLTVGVWAGNSNNTPMQQQGSSILAALPMWNSFMKQVITDYQPEIFPSSELTAPNIPMLNGTQGSTPHSILYYINKNNPTQPVGDGYNPAQDPQFYNWENPVQIWAQGHKS